MFCQSQPAIKDGLKELAKRYAELLEGAKNGDELADICFTAGSGRSHFSYRLAVTGNYLTEVVKGLNAWLSGALPKNVQEGAVPVNNEKRIAFLFTGQGSQYNGMGRQLYELEPVFRSSLDRCNELFSSYHTPSLLDLLYSTDVAADLLDDTTYTQPLLFSVGWSLGQLWLSKDVRPSYLLGHSVGEYAAACIAGVFSVEDGMKLIVNRGKLMGALPRWGGMMSVLCGRERVEQLLADYKDRLWIAAENSPSQVVVSGDAESLNALEAQLDKEGIQAIRLEVSHAFHSGMMEPVLAEFSAIAEQVTYHVPAIPLISLVSGRVAGKEVENATYWSNHILAPVDFRGGMDSLAVAGIHIFLEIGPQPILTPLGMACIDGGNKKHTWLSSMKRRDKGCEQIMYGIAALYAEGVTLHWTSICGGRRTKTKLPNYPFQRSRYWVDVKKKTKQAGEQESLLKLLGVTDMDELHGWVRDKLQLNAADAAVLPKLLEGLQLRHRQMIGNASLHDLMYATNWEAIALQSGEGLNGKPGNWVLFMDAGGKMKELAAELAGRGGKVNLVAVSENIENYRNIIDSAVRDGVTGIVYGRSLDAADNSLNIQLRHLLELSRSMATVAANKVARVWVLTSGGQYIDKDGSVIPAQSSLGGLVAVMSNELQQWQPVLIDYKGDITSIVPELGGKAASGRVAYRNGVRYVCCLQRIVPTTNAGEDIEIHKDGCYLVTGGTGALGLLIAGWLAAKGAGKLVLMSRGGGGKHLDDQVQKLKALGAEVQIVGGNVGNHADMQRVFNDINKGTVRLRGVVHAAGILADGMLANLDWERFEQVLTPKVNGAMLLHEMTNDISLDFFISYSSAAAVLGFSGQANYAAANCYLEGLGALRRSLGLPATVVSWGPWSEGGMVAAMDAGSRARLERIGLKQIDNERAFAALDYIVKSGIASAGVFDIDWSRYGSEMGNGQQFLRHLVSKEAIKPAHTNQRQQIADAIAEVRDELMAAYLEEAVGAVLGMPEGKVTDRELGFSDMGMDSLMAVELKNRLERDLGITLSPTISFNYPRINAMKKHVLDVMGLSGSEKVIKETSETVKKYDREPIAIIGMGCRFPGGANSPEAFWELLHKGVDAIAEVPVERWNVDEYYDAEPETPGKIYTRCGGFIDQVDQFDAKFFGITPNEADYLDPQQRLLLEVSWEALENAGIPVETLNTSLTGVFVGMGQSDYGNYHLGNNRTNEINTYTGTGNSHSFAAGRLSYFLGTQGPSISIDTACSSSLVTVQMACQSLMNGESNLAIAGGVQLMLSPQSTVYLSRIKALSADGRCKTFSDDANGYTRGEGCGMVVLKRLSDAVRDNDNILSVIRGAAINHDGRSSGLTVPNGKSQESLINRALENAGVAAHEVSYVEAHGTGTPLGDPIEMEAIAQTLAANRPTAQPLWVGCVKTNIGHLEQAAGIASLIKVTLAMNQRQIPANLHFNTPSSRIDWKNTAVKIPVETEQWIPESGRLIASISSFGLSGTNAHLVVEEAPDVQNTIRSERPVQLLTLSAKNEAALKALASKYIGYLNSRKDIELADICHTANTGRAVMPMRLALSVADISEATEKLKAFSEGITKMGLYSGRASAPLPTSIAFLFSGNAAPHLGNCREIYEHSEIFFEQLTPCNEVFEECTGLPLTEVLFGAKSAGYLGEPKYSNPALVAAEYAMARFWMTLGLQPGYLLGHGTGEITAACVAGVFSLEDAMRLAVQQGNVQSLELSTTARAVTYHPPVIPVFSTATGKLAGREIAEPGYWDRPISAPADFPATIKGVESLKCNSVLAVGFDTATIQMVKQGLSTPTAIKLFPTTSTAVTSTRQGADCIAELFVHGYQLNLKAWDKGHSMRKVSLPNYPFQRKRHWNGPVPNVLKSPAIVLRSSSVPGPVLIPTKETTKKNVMQNTTTQTRVAIISSLSDMVNRFSGVEVAAEDLNVSFMELGLDSLILVKMIDAIKEKFGIKLSLRQFFEETSSLDALASYLDAEEMQTEETEEAVQELLHMFDEPVQVGMDQTTAAIFKKLEELTAQVNSMSANPGKKSAASHNTGKPTEKLNFKAVKLNEEVPFTDQQSRFIDALAERYNKRTHSSKSYAQQHRHILADWINSIDFRLSLKEFLYPIVSASSAGARFTDIDGNSYIDIGLGYGVNFFGNSPVFVKEAIQVQLAEGMELATQSDIAGEVAQLIQDLTGAERVVFSNTGTEAIMAALRIARTKTGKKQGSDLYRCIPRHF